MDIHVTCPVCSNDFIVSGVQKEDKKMAFCPHCHERVAVVIRDGKAVERLNEAES